MSNNQCKIYFENGWIDITQYQAKAKESKYMRIIIMNEPTVLHTTLRNFDLNVDITLNIDNIYNIIINMISDGDFSIDDFIKVMVENNIQSIGKTLDFGTKEKE